MTRTIPALLACLLLMGAPAHAGFREARDSFDDLAASERSAATLGLIAAGDFEGMAAQDFTPRLYRAIHDFKQREGFVSDGVLAPEQLQRLEDLADDFHRQLGARDYDHPDSGARLPVPRGQFDDETQTPEGLLFTRRDGMLPLAFLSFPARTRSDEAPGRKVSTFLANAWLAEIRGRH